MESLKNRSRLESQTKEVLDRKIKYLITRQKGEGGSKEEGGKKEAGGGKMKEEEGGKKEEGGEGRKEEGESRKEETIEGRRENEEEGRKKEDRRSMVGGRLRGIAETGGRKSEIGRISTTEGRRKTEEGERSEGGKEATIIVRKSTRGGKEKNEEEETRNEERRNEERGKEEVRKKEECKEEKRKQKEVRSRVDEGGRRRNGRYATIERNKVGMEEHFGSDDDSSLPSLTEATLDSLYAKSIDLQRKILSKTKMGFGGRIRQFMRLEELSKTVQKANLQKLTEK